MAALKREADRGVTILGICNGFQVLLEAGLLPGAMRRNQSLKFVCKPCELVVDRADSRFSSRFQEGQTLQVPVAHGEGNYYCDDETLKRLHGEGQVVFRYADNPNGSVADIAGITNETGNVLGMMPHPERATRARLGSVDGAEIFGAIFDFVSAGGKS
jgi:phosphoribosylformylglycinamidine synthase subunit PurQ / glutaminase